MKTGRQNKKSPRKAAPAQRKAADSGSVLGMKPGSSLPSARGPAESRWSWHYWQLTALRERLLRERQQLSEEANEERPHFSMSMADAATDEADRDLLLSGVSSEQELLYEVEEALRRIDDGTYGICQMTRKPIPPQRLKAVPWTRFTVEAQAEAEQKGEGAQTHLGKLGSIRLHVRGNLEASEGEEEKVELEAADEKLQSTEIPPREA